MTEARGERRRRGSRAPAVLFESPLLRADCDRWVLLCGLVKEHDDLSEVAGHDCTPVWKTGRHQFRFAPTGEARALFERGVGDITSSDGNTKHGSPRRSVFVRDSDEHVR